MGVSLNYGCAFDWDYFAMATQEYYIIDQNFNNRAHQSMTLVKYFIGI
jgi:hypothetical protein